MSAGNADNHDIVLISGGASGIGGSIAEAFLQAGASVHVCDSSRKHIDEFLTSHPAASATLADVSAPVDVDRIFDDLERVHGGLTVLVNNAGIAGPTAAIEDMRVEDWDRCIAVNLSGAFYMTRRAVPYLKRCVRASIINVASTAALFGYPLRSPYAASKWAQIGLTKTWAMELGPSGIRVNAICPGSVSGDRIDAVIEKDAMERGVPSERVRDVYLRQTSMRTFVSADDIADMALFLASERAAKISGQVISVDGHTEGLSNWLE